MRELILHIGRAKTGTTTWQEMVGLKRKELESAGVKIPNFFHGDNHGELAAAFAAQPGRLGRAYAVESPEDQLGLQAKLAKKFERDLTGGTWLFTSEHLSTRLRGPAEVDGLYEFLGRYFDRIRVFAYVRRPDDLAPSTFAETIKAGRTHGFNRKYALQARAFFDHAAFVKIWERPLRSEITFTLRPYVRVGHLDDMWQTVFTLAALTPPPFQLLSESTTSINESLSAAALRYLQEVNPLVPDGLISNKSRRMLIAALSGSSGERLLLAPNVHETLKSERLLAGGLNHGDFTGDPRWQAWFDAPPARTGDWPKLGDLERVEFNRLVNDAGVSLNEKADETATPSEASQVIRRAAVRLTKW